MRKHQIALCGEVALEEAVNLPSDRQQHINLGYEQFVKRNYATSKQYSA
jgi:hypothetical protein